MEKENGGSKLILFTVTIFLALAIISLVFPGITKASDTATNSTDTGNVTVTIETMTMIEIQPTALSYSNILPGGIGNSSNEAQNFTGIQIENVGSTNISTIWFNTTYPGTLGNASTRPFGKGLKGEYDAGNFVVISKEGVNDYYYVNRVDYNETRSLIYIKLDSGSWYYGRIRNGSNEYFWVINVSQNGGLCNESGTEFRLGNQSHTRTQTGTVDFRSTNKCGQAGAGNDCWRNITLTNDPDNTDWAAANITLGGQDYCLAVHKNCDTIMLSHWNTGAPGSGVCLGGTYLENFWSGNPLYPGNSTAALVNVRVPYGVAAGQVKTGYIRVWAST